MGEERHTRTFKSGNSVAVRLPKALGIDAGVAVTVREEQGRYIVEPVARPDDRIDPTRFWGMAPDVQPISPQDRIFSERELDWGGDRLTDDA